MLRIDQILDCTLHKNITVSYTLATGYHSYMEQDRWKPRFDPFENDRTVDNTLQMSQSSLPYSTEPMMRRY
jgi:hypothetical protein